MAHHIYRTDAFILRGIDSRESDRYIDLFTRDLGFLRAVAKSARKETSKLRYSLQEHSLSHVSLVRGRDTWRITGAKEERSLYHALKNAPEKLLILKNVESLLRRLLHGEERNEELFRVMSSFAEYLEQGMFDEKGLQALECLTVLRVLYHLGYIPKKEVLCETSEYSEQLLKDVSAERADIIQEINEAIRESQL